MKRLLIVLVVLLVSVSMLIGCGKPATTTTPTPSPTKTISSTPAVTPSATASPTTPEVDKYGGTMKIITIAGPQTPGGVPAEIFGPDATSSQFCMEPLLRGDNKGGVLPWLAETYELADDKTSITFTLRKDVKFHDGTDFNAATAKWNLDNYIARHFNQYWASTEVIDAYTIKVNFRMWVNTILNSFTGVGAWMVSQTSFEENGID